MTTPLDRARLEERAQDLLRRPLGHGPRGYVPSPEFDDAALAAAIEGPMPGHDAYEAKRARLRPPDSAPPEIGEVYRWPLLDRDQERHLFRRMNYHKHLAGLRRERVASGRFSADDLDEAERRMALAAGDRTTIVCANLRLVIAVAKKFARRAAQDRRVKDASGPLWGYLAEGNVALLRAADAFDYTRGFKFSTYATWALYRAFACDIPDDKRRSDRLVTDREAFLRAEPDRESVEDRDREADDAWAAARLAALMEYLEPRERHVLAQRYGLGTDALVLADMAQAMGVTKERVRQLQARAQEKLRQIAANDGVSR